MSAYIKSHPVNFLLFGVLVLLSLRILLWGGLNATGFCWTEKRWLSDDEKIAALIKYENNLSTVRVESAVLGKVEFKHYPRVPYKDVAEFLRSNPNCCKIVPGRLPGGSFMDRIFGEDSEGVPSIQYTAHYLDDAQHIQKQQITTINTSFNCGQVRH